MVRLVLDDIEELAMRDIGLSNILTLCSGKTFDFRTVQGLFGRSAFTIRQLHANFMPFREVLGR